MPELPEVEVLARALDPQLKGRRVRGVVVRNPKVLGPTTPEELRGALDGGRFEGVSRRGKYLLFQLRFSRPRPPVTVVGHLGMTGRMYLQDQKDPTPKHAAVLLSLGKLRFVYEDARYFGRFTLDQQALGRLGPEALGSGFTTEYFARALKRSVQPIKVRLLDQSLVAGVGNIYAAEALFRAQISPKVAARRLRPAEIDRLWHAIREVLSEAIAWGSTIRLDFAGKARGNGLFYYGGAPGEFRTEGLWVYDRDGEPCRRCGQSIRRIEQAARGTWFCPRCQRRAR